MVNEVLGVVSENEANSEVTFCVKHDWEYRGERLDGRYKCKRCGKIK
jgi:hypothetical protein